MVEADKSHTRMETGEMKKLSRRGFMKQTVFAGVALGFPTIIPARVLGQNGNVPPSRRVNIGLISCGERSGAASAYMHYDKSRVVAVCDPVKERRLRRKQQYGNCADYGDFRELLALKDVDAVHISTPDHWHVPISLAAARAGKDMYTEKPLGISIEQDLAAREIVEKHKRIFQYGTQNRSMVQVRMGTELVLNGHIGDVKEVYVWCPSGEAGGSATPVTPVPDEFDYEMWLGPAPAAPFCTDRCFGGGHRKGIYHIYDYALGFIAGWGAHPLDQLQWWADTEKLGIPVRYQGAGKLPAEGLYNTITNWDITCTYANGLPLRFTDVATARQKKNIPHIDEIPFDHGTLYVGTKGWVAVSRGAWKTSPGELVHSGKEPGERRLAVSTGQQRNFVDCVLDRKQPISNLESAIQSDLISQIGDIVVRTGRAIIWDPVKRTIVGDNDAVRMMSRPMRKPWTL